MPRDVLQCNTERKEYADKGMNHWAGGWPRDVDPADVDQTQRFLKKVNKDPEYVKTVQTLGEVSNCTGHRASAMLLLVVFGSPCAAIVSRLCDSA